MMNGNSNNVEQKIIIGVGGLGNRLLSFVLETELLKGRWVAVDTDAQTLMKSLSPKRIQIGEKETRGLGTNGDAGMGRRAAEEAREKLLSLFGRRENVYIFTGIQGGTSLGAVPVLCECARSAGAHTVLYAVIDGETPTEKEKSVLAVWRTLADGIQIWCKDKQDGFTSAEKL